jgi:hypothetical protein
MDNAAIIKVAVKRCLMNDVIYISSMQAKTVPRLFEHPPQALAGPSTMTVTRPKERQVCPLLRTLLKRDRGSN